MSQPGSPSSRLPPPTGQELLDQIRGKIEFWFSRENLVKDNHMKSHMDNNFSVDISFIMQFKSILSLTQDENFVRQAISMSSVVCVVDSRIKLINPDLLAGVDMRVQPVMPPIINPNMVRTVTGGIAGGGGVQRSSIILREIPFDTPLQEVQDIFNYEGCKTYSNIRSDGGEQWYITFDSEDDAKETYKNIKALKTFRGLPLKARVKPYEAPVAPQMTGNMNAMSKPPVLFGPPPNNGMPPMVYNPFPPPHVYYQGPPGMHVVVGDPFFMGDPNNPSLMGPMPSNQGPNPNQFNNWMPPNMNMNFGNNGNMFGNMNNGMMNNSNNNNGNINNNMMMNNNNNINNVNTNNVNPNNVAVNNNNNIGTQQPKQQNNTAPPPVANIQSNSTAAIPPVKSPTNQTNANKQGNNQQPRKQNDASKPNQQFQQRQGGGQNFQRNGPNSNNNNNNSGVKLDSAAFPPLSSSEEVQAPSSKGQSNTKWKQEDAAAEGGLKKVDVAPAASDVAPLSKEPKKAVETLPTNEKAAAAVVRPSANSIEDDNSKGATISAGGNSQSKTLYSAMIKAPAPVKTTPSPSPAAIAITPTAVKVSDETASKEAVVNKTSGGNGSNSSSSNGGKSESSRGRDGRRDSSSSRERGGERAKDKDASRNGRGESRSGGDKGSGGSRGRHGDRGERERDAPSKEEVAPAVAANAGSGHAPSSSSTWAKIASKG